MPVVNDVELRYKWLQKKTFEYHTYFLTITIIDGQ